MAWIMLVVAGVFEWGWPVGLKLGWTDKGVHAGWLTISIICMVASGALLMLAQRVIPIGTAYAVWTGIGAVGTFVIGVLAFGDEATYARFLFVGLIIMGIVGLKLTSLT
jgi:quaternary ammonium compound-resistance protein SugE